MTGYLVDTDWIIDALHGQHDALQTLVTINPKGVAVSVVSYGELYHGAYYASDPATALANIESFMRGKVLLPITAPIAVQFGIMRGNLSRQQRSQIGDMDLLIAATAIVHDLTLVTRNLRDFQLIAGLDLHQSS